MNRVDERVAELKETQKSLLRKTVTTVAILATVYMYGKSKGQVNFVLCLDESNQLRVEKVI